MSISRKLINGSAGALGLRSGETYVEDVFSTYLYKGTNADQDIVNGIDLGAASSGWSVKEYEITNGNIRNDSTYTLGRYSFSQNDPYLFHFNNSGSLLWQKEFATSSTVQGISCNEDHVVVVLTVPNLPDVNKLMVVVYDHDGDLQWESSLESTDNSGGQNDAIGVYINSNDNVYFAYKKSSNGSIVKYSDNGTLLWHRQFTKASGSAESQFRHITESPNGSLYVFGEGLNTSNNHQLSILSKLDSSNGDVLWSENYSTGYGDTQGYRRAGTIHATDTEIVIATSVRYLYNGLNNYIPYVIKVSPSDGSVNSQKVITSDTGPYIQGENWIAISKISSDGGVFVATHGRSTGGVDDAVLVVKLDSSLSEEWAVELHGPDFTSVARNYICEVGSNIIISSGSKEVTLPSDGSAISGTAYGITLKEVSLKVLLAMNAPTESASTYTTTTSNPVMVEGSDTISSSDGNVNFSGNTSPSKGDGAGLVWIKQRSKDRPHYLHDTERGAGKYLSSNETSGESGFSDGNLKSFNSDGFTVGDFYGVNETGEDLVSWTFRKAPKFFDIVTYTGDGVAGREIPHNLGVEPGMIIVKRTSASADWYVQHIGVTSNKVIFLNDPMASYENSAFNDSYATSTNFSVNPSNLNLNNEEYVAYIFAHDDSDESMIKCGSFTTTSTWGNFKEDLGFEPQWLMVKRTDSASDWMMLDMMRGVTGPGDKALDDAELFGNGSNDQELKANSNHEEREQGRGGFYSQGYLGNLGGFGNATYIYMAIRRPNKPAEEFEPEELFAIEDAGQATPPAFLSGFPVDMAVRRDPSDTASNRIASRITSGHLYTDTTFQETNDADDRFDYPNGWHGSSSLSYEMSWMWRRALGFFDMVTYVGDGVVGREVPHNLAAVPEMIWIKNRSNTAYWSVYMDQFGGEKGLWLSEDYGLQTEPNWWSNTDATDGAFTLGNYSYVNGPANNYIAYLFASAPGISKVGSYTGTGGSIDIDCSFINGARWVLIKRTDATGDWAITTNSGLTNMINLNDNAAQIGHYALSPIPEGFNVTQGNQAGASFANQAGAEYIYYAIA